jgi:pimeloyl-ACP methyl ester carboxylesterase
MAEMMKTGFLEVGNASLYYEETGSGSPLVMIHGGLLNGRSWDLQVDAFAGDYRVVRYDARHHGRSRSEPGEFSNFEDLRAVLDGLGIEKALMVGLSLGGRTAIDFAITYPERVTALILVSPGASGFELHSAAFAQHSQEFVRSFQEGIDAGIEYFLRWTVDGPTRSSSAVDASVRDKVRKMALDWVVKQSPQNVLKEIEPPAIGRFNAILAPTLVVVGEVDQPYYRELADMVVTNAQNAEVAVIPASAHMVNMEAPQAFNDAVRTFLAGL